MFVWYVRMFVWYVRMFVWYVRMFGVFEKKETRTRFLKTLQKVRNVDCILMIIKSNKFIFLPRKKNV